MTKVDVIKGLEDILYCGELDLYENEKRVIKDAIFFLKSPEIIRCENCVFYYKSEGCKMHDIMSDPDDFCSYAALT